MAHDVEAWLSKILTRGFEARDVVDRPHRSSVAASQTTVWLFLRPINGDRRKHRLSSASEDAASSLEGGHQRASWRQMLPWMVGISVAVGLVSSVATWTLIRPEPPRLFRYTVAHDEAQSLFIAQTSPDIAISPNGGHVAYPTGRVGLGAQQLVVRPLDQPLIIQIGGEGG